MFFLGGGSAGWVVAGGAGVTPAAGGGGVSLGSVLAVFGQGRVTADGSGAIAAPRETQLSVAVISQSASCGCFQFGSTRLNVMRPSFQGSVTISGPSGSP